MFNTSRSVRTKPKMHQISSVELKRDCEALQIPSGAPVTLPAGTPVDITQTLGGTYTIHTQGGLYRIAAGDADALGVEAGPETPSPGDAAGPPANGPVDEGRVWEALKTCYDPEIPVNIVDLGLVYDMHIQTLPDRGSLVGVKMTLNAPGCGMGATTAGAAQQKILALPGVDEAVVEIVWEPPWHQSMITAQGRKILGLE
jgi:probable FeS assembly SUF system protein SufT